jgi:hypothetical protein
MRPKANQNKQTKPTIMTTHKIKGDRGGISSYEL